MNGKTHCNGHNGLWYELQGDYYIPCLTLGEDKRPIGRWGREHLRYIEAYRPVPYTVLLLGSKLSGHLVEKEGIGEQLKAKDPMACVCVMNNNRSAAEEIVNPEVIFIC